MESTSVFVPDEKLTFKSVKDTLQRFESMLSTSDAQFILCDLSPVIVCDSAGLAFLVEVARLCKLNRKQLLLKNMSQPMFDLATFSGLKPLFEELLDGKS